jgi:hypothetical protein
MRGTWRPEWRIIAGTAAAILLVALFASLLANRGGHTTGPVAGTAAPLPTATPADPTPTATTTPASIPAGWTAATVGTGDLPRIVFAPSAPGVAYAVMIDAVTGRTAVVSGSSDAGKTWRRLATPTSGQDQCRISIDPTDAHDIVLACTPPRSSGYTVLRSTDGGESWSTAQIATAGPCYNGMGWVGSTLLIAFELCDGPDAQTQLFASAGKGPFKRLDADGKLGGVALNSNEPFITGHGPTIYVQQRAFNYNPVQLEDTTFASADGGATWRVVAFSDAGHKVHLLAATPDGRSLIGIYDSAPTQLAVSSDEGKTWRKLPPPWPDMKGINDIFVTPDGTVLATDVGVLFLDVPNTVYLAPPGAAQWRADLDALQLRSAMLLAVQVDASGHPTTLWASYASGTQDMWMLMSHPL